MRVLPFAATLTRLGFRDSVTGEAALRRLGFGIDHPLVGALAEAADPDLALAGLERLLLAAADPDDLAAALAAESGLRDRLTAVLGASIALGDHLRRHPEHWHRLRDADAADRRPSALGLRADLLAAVGQVDPVAGPAALRVAYRGRLLDLTARDLVAGLPLGDVAAELADLAAAALEAALALARAQAPEAAAGCRLAVIAMGKCGGRELNYVSDVDVIFVAEPAPGVAEATGLRHAAALATATMRICSANTEEGSLWAVDAGLRPEGRNGPLVRTLASHLAYYQRWAQTWEFQALLKARAVAGDVELGRAYCAAVADLVWQAAGRPNFVADVQAMRRRVEASVRRDLAARELKLGPGGLRDVEFAVQLLQLVHGRFDDRVRSPGTLAALAELSAGGYVGREDAEQLAEAYRFLRLLEHRAQLQNLRRTSVLPAGEAGLRWLARAAGFRVDPVGELLAVRGRQSREVRRLHEKLFYRPLLSAVARLPGEAGHLSMAAARARLTALGFEEPAAALRHLEALTSGVGRGAAIQRTLLPVMLDWFADAPDPDAGLLAYRRVCERLERTPWFLRLLRDAGGAAERLARLLGAGRYVADLILTAPEGIRVLAEEGPVRPRSRAELLGRMTSVAERAAGPDEAADAIRQIRSGELLRIAGADLLGELGPEEVAEALTEVTVAALRAVLVVATARVQDRRGRTVPADLLIVAMGRLGGREQGYGSDADVLFVHDPHPGVADSDAAAAALDVAGEVRRLLGRPSPQLPLVVDVGLRPEGRAGPLSRSLAYYRRYWARWSAPWEAQALLRAAPVAGDPGLADRFRAAVDPIRWPAGGLDEAAVREIRRIKARVEAERLPRGADPTLHTKLGRGGIADVEWVVQLLQLNAAAGLADLQQTATLPVLAAAARHGLLSPADADTLAAAWRLASRARNAGFLVAGRPAELVPTSGRQLTAVARALGYPDGEAGQLVEDYLRVTRRARAVVERVFYG